MAQIADADLKLLRIFFTIAECGGFAAAQAELNLSAASISSYMSAIEQRLGVRLCSRGRAGFALTDKGAIVYRETQRMLAAVNEFSARAGALRGQLTGSLRVGVVDCTLTDTASPLRAALAHSTRAITTCGSSFRCNAHRTCSVRYSRAGWTWPSAPSPRGSPRSPRSRSIASGTNSIAAPATHCSGTRR